jgi:hypothetical protein
LREKVAVDDHRAHGFLAAWREHRARLEQAAGLRRAPHDDIPPEEAR